ncbi:hypothetical protein JAAARDRAFT_80311 [Jaapia argillacea MUCL 33604]|uniref:Uncharacterized protein n=1 Tax=Jaapia argillacea MUCL 33604 TaxID=933084 RepID=A0A067PVC9_9AGAM|nr:hypothetical protein JAAARDRAFT_80311 [Jaapia argillacea MUCL 33604]
MLVCGWNPQGSNIQSERVLEINSNKENLVPWVPPKFVAPDHYQFTNYTLRSRDQNLGGPAFAGAKGYFGLQAYLVKVPRSRSITVKKLLRALLYSMTLQTPKGSYGGYVAILGCGGNVAWFHTVLWFWRSKYQPYYYLCHPGGAKYVVGETTSPSSPPYQNGHWLPDPKTSNSACEGLYGVYVASGARNIFGPGSRRVLGASWRNATASSMIINHDAKSHPTSSEPQVRFDLRVGGISFQSWWEAPRFYILVGDKIEYGLDQVKRKQKWLNPSSWLSAERRKLESHIGIIP